MRYTCMLAHTWHADRHANRQHIGGWFLSEKLDGIRAIWDGGVTRGISVDQVPWANTDKQPELRERKATGLWTRGWKPVFAPDSWIDTLPNYAMDGELWAGRGMMQHTMSIVRAYNSRGWDNIQYKVFDSPPSSMFRDGSVRVRTGCDIFLSNAESWIMHRGFRTLDQGRYYRTYKALVSQGLGQGLGPASVVMQESLPQTQAEALAIINDRLMTVVKNKGEGLMIRSPQGIYKCERSHQLLKIKPEIVDSAIVTGYTLGKGKYENMIGALMLDYNGQILKLSGLTDEERALDCGIMRHFTRGQRIRFKRVKELTRDGIPKEGRYVRTKGFTM